MSNEAILETINIAIKSQEQIKAQLLAEIAQLEAQNGANKESGAVKFYKASLDRVKQERDALERQIEQYKTNEYPAIQQKLQRVQQKIDTTKFRIDYMKKIRESDITEKLDNPEIAHTALQEFSKSLQEEIDSLDKIEQEYSAKIADAKENLHSLQEANLNKKRTAALSSWDNELNDEKKLNQKQLVPVQFTRKRARTLAQRASLPKNVLSEPF